MALLKGTHQDDGVNNKKKVLAASGAVIEAWRVCLKLRVP